MSHASTPKRSNAEILADMFAETHRAHEQLHGAALLAFDMEEGAADAVSAAVYQAHERMHAALCLNGELDASLLNDWKGGDYVEDSLSAIDIIIYVAMPGYGYSPSSEQYLTNCEYCLQTGQQAADALGGSDIAEAVAEMGWEDDVLSEAIDSALENVGDFIFLALPEPVGTNGLEIANCKHCHQDTQHSDSECAIVFGITIEAE